LLIDEEKYTHKRNEAKVKELNEAALSVRIGGKGSMRRKKKVIPKSQDEAKIQTVLKKISSKEIDDVEEANFFMEDNSILNFKKPKIVAQVNSNTVAVFGTPVKKELRELFPDILSQMGPEDAQFLGNLQGNKEETGKKQDDIPEMKILE